MHVAHAPQRDGKIKEVEKEITKAKADAAKAKTKAAASKQLLNELVLEIESLKAELANLQAQLVDARKAVKAAADEEAKHAALVAGVKQQFDQSEARYGTSALHVSGGSRCAV